MFNRINQTKIVRSRAKNRNKSKLPKLSSNHNQIRHLLFKNTSITLYFLDERNLI